MSAYTTASTYNTAHMGVMTPYGYLYGRLGAILRRRVLAKYGSEGDAQDYKTMRLLAQVRAVRKPVSASPPMAAQPDTCALACLFSEKLREVIGAEYLAVVNWRNERDGGGGCSSHDFCDPNVVMQAAFEELAGRDFDFDNEVDADLDSFNAAWTLAKRLKFDPAAIQAEFDR